jgi:shikimate kinase
MGPAADSKRHLVLIGLMGAGKTTVGRVCAQRLGREFVDTDDVVTRLAGMPVAEVFARDGEAAFRALERDAVADVCASPAALVVGCGGGTVIDAANRRALTSAGFVVWLKAPVAVLAGRVGDGDARPLLRGDPQGALTRLAAMREAAYEAAADIEVETGERTVDEVASAVIDAFDAHGAVSR